MGAPGALIPAEIPSTISAQNPVIDNLSSVAQAVQDLCLALEDKGDCQPVDIKERKNVSKYDSANGCERNDGRLSFEEAAMTALDSSANDAKVIERHRVHLIETGPTELNRPLNRTRRSPSWTEGAASPAEQMKVKDVSQYVMNAAKENPDFAQRLHAVLLESGVPAPPHLFADISSQQVAEQKLIKQKGFAEETRVNDFQRRRQKIPLGPGRPPQPISRQKSSICNGGIGEKSQVDLVEGMGLRRSFEASDSNVSPLTAISASHDPHSPVPGISNIIGTHVSLIPSSSGTPAAFGQNCIQESLPVAATAAVVAASVVVATSKCDETPIETPMAVAANIVASASVANQKHTEVHCVFSRNFVGKECPYNRVKAKELSESERKVHSGHEGQEHINDGLVGARGNSEHELAYSTTAYNSRQDSLMDDVAEWEIPWEDLLIGERIGLGIDMCSIPIFEMIVVDFLIRFCASYTLLNTLVRINGNEKYISKECKGPLGGMALKVAQNLSYDLLSSLVVNGYWPRVRCMSVCPYLSPSIQVRSSFVWFKGASDESASFGSLDFMRTSPGASGMSPIGRVWW
eukprot:Gb_40237 [translate_table: standard]